MIRSKGEDSKKNGDFLEYPLKRRSFFSRIWLFSAPFMMLNTAPAKMLAGETNLLPTPTVGDLMDLFIGQATGSELENTVDTLKSGSRDTVISGVVTSMFPTLELIQKSVKLNCNFIIVHEPSFYNHSDETDWLQNDPVFLEKKALLDQHRIAVWRNHDYIHLHKPDGIYEGFIEAIGWRSFYRQGLFHLPDTNVQAVINTLKKQFQTGTIRYIGDLNQSCSRILYLPGAPGGRHQIQSIAAMKPDLVICGELQEWETAEYIRDARAGGIKITLAVMGHVASEEPGSAWMAEWVKKHFPFLPVTHIPSENPFQHF